MVLGLPTALLDTVSVPEIAVVSVRPIAVTAGENVTFTVQLAAGATVVQLFVCENGAETETLVTSSGAVPVLVTRTGSGVEVVPIDWTPNSSDRGATETVVTPGT